MSEMSAAPIYIPSAGVVWPFTPNEVNRVGWQTVLDTPGARLVTYDGVLATAAETDAIAALFLAGPEADAHGVFMIETNDLMSEADVRALLDEAVANRQSAAFARRAGVSKVLIGQVLQRNRKPGTSVLDALGVQRIRGTAVYMKKIPGAAEFDSDNRGGRGGTQRKPGLAA
tara:strand:- start:38257 stop:38772 length:516 start_codon:yes stop_codon:yes gene_type:complete